MGRAHSPCAKQSPNFRAEGFSVNNSRLRGSLWNVKCTESNEEIIEIQGRKPLGTQMGDCVSSEPVVMLTLTEERDHVFLFVAA